MAKHLVLTAIKSCMERVKIYVDNIASGKAPTSHSSTGTTYGKGSSSSYGHVKLSDSISSTSSTASGIAATPAAVKKAYDLANDKLGYDDFAEGFNFISFIRQPGQYGFEFGECLNFTYTPQINGVNIATVEDFTDVYAFTSNGYAGIDEVTTDLLAKTNTATFVISPIGSRDSNADYTCDGTNDQEQINAAINALPASGGKIVLREGTYNLTGAININKANVTIEGMGKGATTLMSETSNFYNIRVSSDSFSISNLSLYRGDDYLGDGAGIYVDSTGTNCLIKNMEVSGFGWGLNVKGSYSVIDNVTALSNNVGILPGADYIKVTGCITDSNTESGIRIEGDYVIVANNHCNADLRGIYILGNSYCIDASQNIFNDCSDGIASYGVAVTLSANTCLNCGAGIYLSGSKSIVIGNTCYSENADSAYSIWVDKNCTDSFITNNITLDQAYITASTSATNTFINNKS